MQEWLKLSFSKNISDHEALFAIILVFVWTAIFDLLAIQTIPRDSKPPRRSHDVMWIHRTGYRPKENNSWRWHGKKPNKKRSVPRCVKSFQISDWKRENPEPPTMRYRLGKQSLVWRRRLPVLRWSSRSVGDCDERQTDKSDAWAIWFTWKPTTDRGRYIWEQNTTRVGSRVGKGCLRAQ